MGNEVLILRGIQILLVAWGLYIIAVFIKDYVKNKEEEIKFGQRIINNLIGFVFQFLDALGIGSFAPTMSALKINKYVPDSLIPGTLNVGASLPVVVESVLFITVIDVDILTLIIMVGACAIGTAVGVKLQTVLPERAIQLAMGTGLLIAGIFMIMSQLGVGPQGGDAIGLTGAKLVFGALGNFILGILLPLGIGNYAPCMALVYLLGMDPSVTFPIMMCSAAFGLCTGAVAYMKTGNYHRRASLGIMFAGSLGVVIAVFIVKSLPTYVLKWLVSCVILYTSVVLYKQAFQKKEKKRGDKGPL